MRKVVLTPSDFGMFDTDINSVEFEFFQKHKEAFKRMWIEQGKKFWIQFVITFRQFAADYGVIKEFPAKNEHFEDCIDQGFIIIHETFVDGKFTTARNFIMDIVMVAQNRHTLQYLESKSYAKDPFYNKETRDVFRRLFGSPTEKASYVKVYVLLPLYMKYGGAVCICLRRWLEAEDCVDTDIANPLTNGSNKTLQTKECNKKPRTIQDSVKTKHSSEINNSIDDGKQMMKNKKKRSDQGNNTLNMVEIDESSEQRSAKKDMKQKKDSSTLTNINNGDDDDDDFPTDKAEALKKLEDISKDFVDSMHSHPCIRSSTMTLEVNEGKEKRSSVYHLDKGMAGEEERMQAMEEAEEKFRRAMREEEYNDDFFKMYIEEITKGSTKGPVHVPGWPEEKDPRFYDSDNPLYDPDSKKEEWKSNLRLPDFQKFVRYVIEEYVKGPKGEMASIAARFDLKEPTFVVGRDVCSSKRSPNCLSKNTPEEIARKQEMDKLAKQEEEKRKKIEDERKRQKKIRKKLKKGLPLNAEELSSTTSMKLANSSESNQDSGTSSKCKLSNPHDTCSQEKVSPLEESPDPRKPYIMEDRAKEKYHEPKLLEKEKMKEGEKNSMKFTKKVDEKAGTVSLTIEKRDDKGRLTKETTVKPISEDGKIWDEAVKRITPEAMMNKPPPVLKDEVQKELAQKLSKNNYFEKKSGEESSKTPEGVNSTNTWLTGDEMQDQDKRQFREMYHEISAAIADVSRQNQAEEEGKTYCTANETRQEKARNRLRRKIGEKKPERKNAELPGLLRLCGNVEYPQNEREAMMLTLAEMTKMNPREKELFQERLGRTKYFRDCQEDPRDVADSMGACLFPGIKKTLTDSKSKKKKVPTATLR